LDAVAGEFKVISYDQRGCGRSSDLPLDQITADAHLDDLEGLRLALGLERLNLIGHSLGALLALLYAARYPGSTASIVLANAGPPFVMELMEVLEQQFGGATAAEDRARMAEIRKSDRFRAREPGIVEDYFRLFYLPFFRDRASASRLNWGFTQTTARHVVEAEEAIVPQILAMQPEGLLSAIACPTLVIHAERDVIPQAFSEFLAARIPGAELAVLPGTSHFAFFEDPALFNSALLPFLHAHAQ
jgi:proline iminopeptidase